MLQAELVLTNMLIPLATLHLVDLDLLNLGTLMTNLIKQSTHYNVSVILYYVFAYIME